VSPHTVHNHVKALYRAFGVSSRYELFVAAAPRSPRDESAPDRLGAATDSEAGSQARLILEHAPDFILQFDRDGMIQFINRTAPGFNVDQVRGTHFRQWLPPAYHDRHQETLDAVFEDGRPRELKMVAVGPYGGWQCYHVRFNRVDAVRRGESSVIAIARDIAGRADDETCRIKEADELRLLIEGPNEWIWEVDAECVYRYASPRVRKILGFEPSELLGRRPFEFMPPEEADQVEAEYEMLAAARAPLVRLRNTNRRSDGQLVTLETSAAPLLDANGSLMGYRGVDTVADA
jgi:PAS domain S-box-containing protein